ncbi:hypothetical protein Ahy_B10g100765 [Arachis hypogaea]|uniref:Uncharacterized protein n=1 Tax=Arachis hypogaea TaxID=3818 RepID=A0A444WXP4_ARAHY|nr:hypothetical protein Ahy_B10g100765 [Arachis hypogaea]
MSDRVLLKVYYFGQILLQTSEGIKFICENPLDVVIPFIISFEELKGVICEKIDSERARKISCILYRYPVQVIGGFIQFQTKYVTDEASMQEMFSMYIENWAQISLIELYVEFEQSEADRNIVREDYNSDSEEEFESNYEFVGPDGDEDQGDGNTTADVTEVANALTNEVPFEEPSFMRVLDLEAMHVPEFSEYMTAGNIQVSCFDRHNEVFKVREMPSGLEFAVDLRGLRCDCGEFQVDRIPCRYVFACCANQRLDWKLYVHDVYKMEQIRQVYRARFRPLGNPTTWPAYHGPRFVPNPYLRRVSKGRPRMTRFLNEMDTRMLRRPRRCTLCGAEGHSRSKCRRSAGTNADGDDQ